MAFIVIVSLSGCARNTVINTEIGREHQIVALIYITVVAVLLALAIYRTTQKKYAMLVANSSLKIRIINNAKKSELSTGLSEEYDNDAMIEALTSYPLPAQIGENTLLFAAEITGGYAIWQEDISGLNRLHNEIKESMQKLEAANAVLAEQAQVKRTIEEENARTYLMEQLETEITIHTIKLSAMIEQLDDVSDRSQATARITLLLCYIRRRCSLFFRERENDILPADELTGYFDELAEIAGYSGVRTILTSEIEGQLSVRHTTLLYDFFYNVAFWTTLYANPRLLAHLGTENGSVVLKLLPSEDAKLFQMERSLENAVILAGGTYSVKDLDDAIGLSLSFPIGGDGNV